MNDFVRICLCAVFGAAAGIVCGICFGSAGLAALIGFTTTMTLAAITQ